MYTFVKAFHSKANVANEIYNFKEDALPPYENSLLTIHFKEYIFIHSVNCCIAYLVYCYI